MALNITEKETNICKKIDEKITFVNIIIYNSGNFQNSKKRVKKINI